MKAKQFREMVVRWRGVTGEEVPEVEFFHPWPKHEHLTPEQLRWFLYWRTEWEAGRVHKTSVSYMMIHIFELLSLEYIQQPELAVERLIRFYTEFRNLQPRLDVTVVRWIGDLYLKMGELDHALYWYTNSEHSDLYEKLSWYRYGNLDIPMPLLKKIGGHQKTQFYKERMPEIEETVAEMMSVVFRTFAEKEGMHPLDKYARYMDDPVVYLFSSTPVHEKLYLDGFRRYEYAGSFVHFVKNALRYAENLLRRAEGKSWLKCDEAIGVYFEEVEPLYPAPVKPSAAAKGKAKEAAKEPEPLLSRQLPEEPVELDMSRVQALTTETDWVVDMMEEEGTKADLLFAEEKKMSLRTQGNADDAAGGRDFAALDRATGLERAQNANPATESLPAGSVVPGVTPAENLIGDLFASDEGDIVAFLEGLSEGHRAFLRHLVAVEGTGENTRRPLADWLKPRRLFLDATVMAINEEAMEAGLEPLLIEEEDRLVFEDEYAEAIRQYAQGEGE
ncbi:MAG TPA: TerB N-terminal domain-containing protein [Bacilli bacterium]|nr:TerB N-terminal domain-containing protein [Bacilli bacterium]